MTEKQPPKPSPDLEKRIEQARQSQARPPEHDRSRGAALGTAVRLTAELVVGMIIGGGMGWLLDSWLGTRPWLLLLFFILGAAAGIKNVGRIAREMNEKLETPDDNEETRPR